MLGDGMVSFGVIPSGATDCEVVEGGAEDRLLDPHRAVDDESGRGEVEVAVGVVEVHLDLLVGTADALDLVDEVHVPRRTTELAVGHRLEPGILLQAYDVRDRGVLGVLPAARR